MDDIAFEDIPVSDIKSMQIKGDDTELSSIEEKVIRYDLHFKARNPKLSSNHSVRNYKISLRTGGVGMKNTMEYKGYIGSVEFSEEDCILYGKVMGIHSLISYEGETAKELLEDFHGAVDDYLTLCKE